MNQRSLRALALACAAMAALGACSPPATLPPPDTRPADATMDVPSSACAAPLRGCMGACVDVNADRNNCGGCGIRCTDGQACVAGSCSLSCPSGQNLCGSECATITSDARHCGACGRACSAGEVCSAGRCATTCATGYTECGGGGDAGAGVRLCADTQTDPRHCGACGAACPGGQSCVAGRCVVACGAGLTECSGACVDTRNSPSHCGMCGNACMVGQVCGGGMCAASCPTGQTSCGGSCVDTNSDIRHCGACGTVCPVGQSCAMGMCRVVCASGQTECMGACVDTQTSRANCGTCGNACPMGQSCQSGMCAPSCSVGQAACGGRCTDISSDQNNCGRCGTMCPAGQLCNMGVCAVRCGASQTNCSGRCVNIQTDVANCGTCGNACPTGFGCVAGGCFPLTGTDAGACLPPSLQCGSTCTDARNDNANCGRCGNACSADRTCFSGMCLPACEAGQTRCGAAGACTSIQVDSANCGACGVRCASGESCALGVCVPDPSFRITTLSVDPTMCRLSPAVDDFSTGGGDQGSGLAVTAINVFYTGDTSTVFLPAGDISTVTRVSPMAVIELLASDLRGSVAYAFADAAGNAPTFGGAATITQLRALNSSGMFSGTSVMLSRALAWTGSGFGIYSGYGRIIVYLPSGADQGYWQIAMPTGMVTRLTGTVAPLSPASCERQGHWGIAEFFGGSHYIVYVRSGTGIVRQQISTGTNTTITAASGTGDVCTLGFSPARNRWYSQYEATPVWAPTGGTGEHIVSCPATWELP